MDIPELNELAELLPERDAEGRFFWQDYVDRIAGRFDGLPAPDGGESFVRACLAAGCRAVRVMERNVLWKNRAPPQSEGRARAVFEFRVRLGLFLAASLRYLAHGVCRLRAGTGDAEWHPLDGGEASFRAFLEAHGGEPGIAWRKTTPDYGQVCLCALFFFQRQEVLLVSPVLAREVLGFLDPDKAAGLFGRMLVHDGQVEGEDTDAAGVFLEAMVQAVERKRPAGQYARQRSPVRDTGVLAADVAGRRGGCTGDTAEPSPGPQVRLYPARGISGPGFGGLPGRRQDTRQWSCSEAV